MDWWEMPPVQGQGWRGGSLSWALQGWEFFLGLAWGCVDRWEVLGMLMALISLWFPISPRRWWE